MALTPSAPAPPHVSGPVADGPEYASERPLFYPLCGMLLLFVVVLLRTAWMGDDAFIPARSMDNLVNGFGLRWNVTERVQVFTEPLWFFIVTAFYFFTREPFVTTIVLNMVTALAAVLVMVRGVASSNGAAVAGLAILVSSKAFIDYATAGLENALGYLLVALFCVVLFRGAPSVKRLQWLILIASLSGFNRLDSVLLFAPAIAHSAWSLWRTGGMTVPRFLAVCFFYSVPMWGWLLFATIYFGFTFPNTYYAKMYTGVPKDELLVQGILYYFNSINVDPVTLVAIGLALAVGFATRTAAMRACAAGVLLYLLYTINIGGDFMTGRFFSVPLFFCTVVLSRKTLPRTVWVGLAVLFAAVGLLSRKPILLSDETYGQDLVWESVNGNTDPTNISDRRGISDERGAFFQGAGLITSLNHNRFAPTFDWAVLGRQARLRGRHMVAFETPGFYGYYAGPNVYVLDTYALCDPLLSKLPIDLTGEWRVGHYRRGVPVGYIESLQTSENLISDPKIRELYRVTKMLSQDPIWSVARLKEIAKMNLGFYKGLIESIDLTNVAPPPAGGVTYGWAGPPGKVEPGTLIVADVIAGWGREQDSLGAFWWAKQNASVGIFVPAGNEAMPIILPVQFVGKGGELRFYVNGRSLAPENLGPYMGGPFVALKISGPWKSGRNVLQIMGSGEPVRPSGEDPRSLLFAVREPRWAADELNQPADGYAQPPETPRADRP